MSLTCEPRVPAAGCFCGLLGSAMQDGCDPGTAVGCYSAAVLVRFGLVFAGEQLSFCPSCIALPAGVLPY